MVARPFVANKETAEERVEGYIKEGDDHLPKVSEKNVGVEGKVSLLKFSFVQINAEN